MKKFVLYSSIFVVTLLVLYISDHLTPRSAQPVLTIEEQQPHPAETVTIRSEVFGEVAPGVMYTTLLNLHELEPELPASVPYLLQLSATGSVVHSERVNDNVIDYQKHHNDLYSLGRFDGDTPIKEGSYVLYDAARAEIGRLAIKSNPNTDIHGILRLQNGNFIVPSYHRHYLDATSSIESFVIEEQTPDGTVVMVWDSIDHVPLEEARFTEQRAYWTENGINDYFHGNSIAEANDGNLLISARHTNTIYKIDRVTGEILWRLGGVASDFTFRDDPQNGFSHQHSVTQLPNGNILLYDNGNLNPTKQSRVVEYAIDESMMTARLVWSYTDGRFTYATGSVQRLRNGNTLIGWGLEQARMRYDVPRITEVDASGRVVLHVYVPTNSGFYNVYKRE